MNQPDEMTRLVARVTGRVQGVGYRYFVQDQARRLGFKGWTRNEYDRSVTVVAEGTRGVLEDVVSRLRVGPPGSHVEGVQVDWQEATGEFPDFRIR